MASSASSATPRAGNQLDQEFACLLNHLKKKPPKLCIIPEDKAVHHSLARLYEREEELYGLILGYNLEDRGVSAPVPDAIYNPLVWADGRLMDHPLRSSCNVPFTEADANRFVDYNEFTHYQYVKQLEAKFYADLTWFRFVVKSFWGGPVECAFELTATGRPIVLVRFDIRRQHIVAMSNYVDRVKMFAYIMARHCPIEGLGPLTDIFGFTFIDCDGRRISEFEKMDRVDMGDPADITKVALITADDKRMEIQQKVQDKSQKLVMCHVLQPGMNQVIEII
ncbi:hypothetical protein F5Y13DRAFT_157345 [Hypoxylon sp. FL1857]|nr:hypothetical protein F5Y13DRAFT_157345 [Hypoxylon sp. FL1857]